MTGMTQQAVLESANERLVACAFEGCDHPVYSNALCIDHYAQQQVRKPLTRLSSRKTLSERMEAHTDKSGECWVWTAGKDKEGYGQVSVGGSKKRANRIAYELAYGAIPEGFMIKRICETHACVRPEHLIAVTSKQSSENRKGAARVGRSGVRGAYWDKKNERWRAMVTDSGKQHYLGLFETAEEAGAVAKAKRLELFTHNYADRTTTKREDQDEQF